VIRGRGFVNNASDLRASYRYGSYDSPTFRYYGIGLRCSRTP
jgi:hypothetical protein